MARFCELTTPLGDALRFHRMRVSEGLSRLPRIEIEAVAERADIDPAELLGKKASVRITHGDGQERFYDGYVVRIALGGAHGRMASYRLEVVPWLWFLTRTSDCRIFQAKTVPDVIAEVFEDETEKKVDDRLAEKERYKPWEYCVQYRETDFNFVARLAEQEGIYWFFEYADGAHTLALVDSKGSHDPIEGVSSVRYVPRSREQVVGADMVTSWHAQQEIQPGEYRLAEYNFKTPNHDLATSRRPEIDPAHAKSAYDIFDFPGDYDAHDEGEQYVATRIEELNTQARVYSGAGALRAFHVGRTFVLEDHPRDDQNRSYLITSTEYEYFDPSVESGDGGGSGFTCSFTAIRADQQFRPPRLAARPVIPGIQSAVVTGPSGEEIHTDEYGRVKVQFHWDRYGKKDEHTSCWLRVAFLAAGDHWGFISIPRIGHEVIVSFLEGDPDRPLIVGVVYNANNKPPWDLPANKTQWGMLSRSTLQGAASNANALRFEDKKGEEQVWLHAEKNQDIEVENDETHWVGHDRTKTIDHDETVHVKHDRTETVDNDETITIHHNRTERVDVNETISVGGNRAEDVTGNETVLVVGNRDHAVQSSETLTVALQRTHTVGINETIAIGGAQEIAIGLMQTVAIGSTQEIQVGSDRSLHVGGNHVVNTDGEHSEVVQKGRTVQVQEGDSLTVGKDLIVEAGDSITLRTGSASITLKKDGTINIKGKDVTIEGSGKITGSASGEMVLKGSKITQN